MNYYIAVINETLDYIEENISEKLSLGMLSKHFGISDFHYNRIFKTVTGVSMKQYILGRKLTKAMQLMRESNQSIIDIALNLGFEYPEVFSRAFKKQFGIPPTRFREELIILEGVPKASIVERDIISCRGGLSVKGRKIYLEEVILAGIAIELNVNSKDFQHDLKTYSEKFLTESSTEETLSQDKFYTIVSCHGDDSGDYTIFCGREVDQSDPSSLYKKITIPKGWYAQFEYQGNMFDIQGPLMDDLYKWIMFNEAELNNIGIGMIDIYHGDYPINDAVAILFPIKG